MKENAGNLLLGFVAGAATGVIAGILLAPDSGRNTRKNLVGKASQFKDDFNTSVVQKGVERISSFKDSVFSLINGEGQTEESAVNDNSQNY